MNLQLEIVFHHQIMVILLMIVMIERKVEVLLKELFPFL